MKKKKLVKILSTVGGVLVLGVAYLFGGPLMFSSCGSTGDYALDRLRDCPEAAELLGDDIDTTWGISYGSTESQGGLERASVTIPVAGSKARGSYSYVADRVGDTIRFSGGVEIDGKTIDVGTCGSDSGGGPVGTASLTGRVTSSSHPNIAEGSPCNGTVSLLGEGNRAKVLVKCDGIAIYNGEGTATVEGETMTFSDDKKSDEDGSPALSIEAQEGKPDGESGTLTISDIEHGSQPEFEITIAI